MNKDVPANDRFNWWLPLCGALMAIAGFLLAELSNDWDWLTLGYYYGNLYIVIPGLVLCLLCFAAIGVRHRKRYAEFSMAAALVVYGGVSSTLLKHSVEYRPHILWALHSRGYKTRLLAQPRTRETSLTYVDWYGWGMAGQDTDIYLAYDPKDSLAHRDSRTGRYGPLRCDVWRVQRLESHWYAVTFYTNTVWEWPSNCDTGALSPQ